MPCKTCSGNPKTPIYRTGLPTIWSWGPYLDHEDVPKEDLEQALAAYDIE